MNNSRTIFLAGLVLVLAALAAYRNSLDAPFLFDDTPAIVANDTLRHLWPPWSALNPPVNGAGVTGRPLVNLSLAVNYAFGRLEVRGYHVMNLVLHILATLTLWGVLRRTWRMETVGRGRRTPPTSMERRDQAIPPYMEDAELLAFASALLWTVHPLLTESVVCVVQRNEVMGGLFYLLTLYCFIRAAHSTASTCSPQAGSGRVGVGRDQPLRPLHSSRSRPTAAVWQSLAVISCLLGMASKEIVATAPLLVLLYDRTFVAGTLRDAWRKRKRFYGALAATWLLLAWLMWHNRQRGGTVGFGLGVSAWEYLLTQAHALMLYLKLSFWPHPLVLDYGAGVVRHVGDVWRQGLLIVALLLATGFALRRRPVPGFVAASFFVILAPSSSFVPLTTQTVAEHRMYLPLAAVIVLAVAGLQALAGQRPFRPGGRRAVAGFCLVVAVALGLRTVARNEDYRDELIVWAGALAEMPRNARAQSGVGMAYYQRGNMPEAARHYELALQLIPWSAYSHYNLGLALDKLDRSEEALAHYRDAVKLLPTFAPAQAELGALLVKLGRNEEALSPLKSALTNAPDMVGALNSLGSALAGTGKIAEAAAAYEQALAIEPDSADAHFNFGLLLAASGRTSEAGAHYTEAVRLNRNHGEARLNLGILLAQTGRVDEAIGHLREAVRLKPDLPEAQANLGIALAVAGRAAEAVGCYEAALRLRPDYPVAHYNLGNALVQLQRWGEAKRHFAEAVRLAPGFTAARKMLERLQAAPDGP